MEVRIVDLEKGAQDAFVTGQTVLERSTQIAALRKELEGMRGDSHPVLVLCTGVCF